MRGEVGREGAGEGVGERLWGVEVGRMGGRVGGGR